MERVIRVGNWRDELFVAFNHNGQLRVYQKTQNLMMHAGSRSQRVPDWVRDHESRWIKRGRKYYLQITERAYRSDPDFWDSKLTAEDEAKLERREQIASARKSGIPDISMFLSGSKEKERRECSNCGTLCEKLQFNACCWCGAPETAFDYCASCYAAYVGEF